MKQSGFGIASMILGIIGILLSCIGIGIIPALIGLVFSIIGLCSSDTKKGTAIAGLTCSVVAVCIFFVFVLVFGGSDDESEKPKKIGTTEKKDEIEAEKDESKQFYIGDVVECSGFKISFLSAGEYSPDNEFVQPKDGYVYYKMSFEFENISDSDQTISSFLNWECYADDYSVDQVWIEDDQMDATLSPSKKIKGSVYFEVPKDCGRITLEYKINPLTSDKIEFIAKP